MPSTPITFPDLRDHQVIGPGQNVSLKDFKLTDGTPLIGPDGFLIPQARSFATIVNSGTRVYSYRFDEAMRDNWINARAMRRDAFIRGLMEERILPTINREFTVEVDDERDPEQQFVRDGMLRILRSIPNFDALKRALLDAVWFGRAGVQWTWGRNEEVDNLWSVARWDPVHGDSVQFTFDGVPAILMDAATTSWYANHGATRGPGGDIRPTDRGGSALVLQRPNWRERFAIHQHILEKADFFEGELAGSVQGLGIRGLVYWQYVLRTDALTWMLAYMQAVGQMDLLVFNYPAGNAAAQRQQEMNAQQVIGKAAIACPRNPAQNWPAVEQIPMNEAGLRALQALVADYFDRHIERLIVGQSMSSGQDKGTGLGGTGRAEFAKACVPVEGSEILTRDGFKSPETVQVGEEVLAYDAETDTCRWTPLLKKSFYEDCEVVRMFTEQNRFEAICTPDHSWAVEKTAYKDHRRVEKGIGMVAGPRGAMRRAAPKRYLVKAHDLKKRENIVLAAREEETETSLLTPTEAALLGWVITDGTIRRYDGPEKGTRYSVAIFQSKEEHFEAIRALMMAYAGGLHETVVETKERTFPMNGKTCATKPQHMWFIPRELGGRLLQKAGYVDRSSLPRIVTRLSADARAAMFKAMMAGDGCQGGVCSTFSNTDPHVIEALEILCALEGVATGYTRPKKNDPRYKQCYDKTIKTGRLAYGQHIQTEAVGRTDVWCPTTKYGTWVMRQNGRVMITGNTKDEILIYDAGRLDQTLTNDLLRPLKRYNFPWAKFPVKFKSVLPDIKAGEKVQAGTVMVQMGIPIKAQEMREAAGFSAPEPGDETVGAPMMPGGGGGPGGPGGPPPGGGGGGPPPSWQGMPLMLARGQNPIRYMGQACPGGANTFAPNAWGGTDGPAPKSRSSGTQYATHGEFHAALLPKQGLFDAGQNPPPDPAAVAEALQHNRIYGDFFRDEGREAHAAMLEANEREYGDVGQWGVGLLPVPEGGSTIRVNADGYDSWTRQPPRGYTIQMRVNAGRHRRPWDGPEAEPLDTYRLYAATFADPAEAHALAQRLLAEGAVRADEDPWGYHVLHEHATGSPFDPSRPRLRGSGQGYARGAAPTAYAGNFPRDPSLTPLTDLIDRLSDVELQGIGVRANRNTREVFIDQQAGADYGIANKLKATAEACGYHATLQVGGYVPRELGWVVLYGRGEPIRYADPVPAEVRDARARKAQWQAGKRAELARAPLGDALQVALRVLSEAGPQTQSQLLRATGIPASRLREVLGHARGRGLIAGTGARGGAWALAPNVDPAAVGPEPKPRAPVIQMIDADREAAARAAKKSRTRRTAERGAADPAANWEVLADLLGRHGPMRDGDLRGRALMPQPAYEAALEHARGAGLAALSEVPNPTRRGATTRVWSLAEAPPAAEEPQQYNLQDQRAFEQALDANPLDAITHGVYADWLREQGRPQHALIHDRMRQWAPHAGNLNSAALATFAGHANVRDLYEENFDYARGGAPTAYGWLNCPPGGATLGGRPYRAGQFIPGTTMFTHTPRQQAINPQAPVAYDEREALEAGIDANPLDWQQHLVLADWLQERDDPDAAFRRSMGNWVKSLADRGHSFLIPGEDGDPDEWVAGAARGYPEGVGTANNPWAGIPVRTNPQNGRFAAGVDPHEPATSWNGMVPFPQGPYDFGWRTYRGMEEALRRAFRPPTQNSRQVSYGPTPYAPVPGQEPPPMGAQPAPDAPGGAVPPMAQQGAGLAPQAAPDGPPPADSGLAAGAGLDVDPRMAGPQPVMTPGLTPDEAMVELQSQQFAWANYPLLRTAYFTGDPGRGIPGQAQMDPVSGDVRSLTLDQAAWEPLLPGYTGTNGPAVQAAAAWLNGQLYGEALTNQYGKGNAKVVVVAGTGSLPPDSALQDYFKTAGYPLVIDGGESYPLLAAKLEGARAAGFRPELTYVDQQPAAQVEESVARAMDARLKGQPARTTPLATAIRRNLNARRAVLELLFRNPDVPVRVVDRRTTSRFQRRLITDPRQAAMHLAHALQEDEASAGLALARIRQDILARHRAGELPVDVVTGLLGEGWWIHPPVPPASLMMS